MRCPECDCPMPPKGKRPFIKNGIDNYFHANGCSVEKTGPHAAIYKKLLKELYHSALKGEKMKGGAL